MPRIMNILCVIVFNIELKNEGKEEVIEVNEVNEVREVREVR